jgi:heme/copper-type cytochrome/quinol oxidase subunit 2
MRKRYCKALRCASSLNAVHSHPTGNPIAEVIFWIAAVICIVAELARPGNSATAMHAARGSEMLWAVIPAIGLLFLLAATWRAVNH